MTLYHITKYKYLPSIKINGLITNSGMIGFCPKNQHKHYMERHPLYLEYGEFQPIFLTDNPDYICSVMLNEDWINKHKAVLLEINLELFNEPIYCHEVLYLENIEPQNIKKIKILFKEP